ncbi:cytochrome P460 [Vibrio splendidus]|uniref:cytochrome P460 family protein n=1 Tax=Vibrio splendidus TaxID=29497 RepID=UPI000D332636|nr:cytochrome P460 family protein [Vibrio splendidus]PTO87921.1 cytochrome P460 [Vibrio splendidus]PTP46753.1 cytochrome P460 [Vibrio splendidus]
MRVEKFLLGIAVTITSSVSFAQNDYAQFTDEGSLVRPQDYREWIFAGTATTPKIVNNDVLFPDFQNIYIDPDSYKAWKETGTFPEGTIMVKEILDLGLTNSPVGKGFYQGDFRTLSAAVKSKVRYPDTVGNWNYFSFVNKKDKKLNKTAKPLGSRCSGCHEANAPEGGAFYNYFSVLRDSRGIGKNSAENSDFREGLSKLKL